jgi:4-hydroxybutyrate CoA-transferase
MSWQQVYQERLVDADEAVKLVQSGDTVVFSIFPPRSLQEALHRRADELSSVTMRLLAPAFDPGWFRPGNDGRFNIEFELYIGDFARFVMDERRASYLPNLFSLGMKAYDQGRPDVKVPEVAMVVVSPPNKQGYCHFGPHHWVQRNYARRVKTVLAEVNPSLPQVHGDCYVHVSEIDRFVEVTPPTLTREQLETLLEGVTPERQAGWRQLADELPDFQPLAALAGLMTVISPDDARRFLGLAEPPDYMRAIAGYLRELIQDGETIQIGTGEPSRFMTRLGAFEGRHDLGIHTELGWPGLATMVRDGIATGKHKEIHKGKAVATAWTGCDFEDLAIIDDNPAFELYDPDYVLHPRTLTKFDRFVAINNAITVDLIGQINSESVFGGRMINGTGGQPEMHLAGAFSPGGRAITLLPSTALEGSVSKIVAQMDAGSYVTIPRFYADYVVTEYGIARLWGKTHRQRAEELIAVAHPDFRGELREQAKRLWWP